MLRFLTSAICLVALGGLGSSAVAQNRFFTANKGALSVVTLTETVARTTTSSSYTDLDSTAVTIPAGQ